MLDAREPKNGDFATYVENLTRHPPTQHPMGGEAPKHSAGHHGGPAPGAAAPGGEKLKSALRAWSHGRAKTPDPHPPAQQAAAQAATQPTAQAVAQASRSAPAPANPPAASQRVEGADPMAGVPPEAVASARASLAKLLERASAIATFVGIAMIATSFADDPPFFSDPLVGVALLFFAGIANRIKRSLA